MPPQPANTLIGIGLMLMAMAVLPGIAVIANIGHYCIVRAYDHAEASLLAPLAYTEMVTSTILGLIFFGDFPDRWTFLGVTILIGCAIYISVRERARTQQGP